jgi:6-phosphogluconolactonase
MTTKVVPGMLVAMQTADDVAREAAARIAKVLRDALKQKGKASLALSGGETPRATYAQLAREDGIAWSAIDVLFVDDRCVPPDHARSNYKLAKETLFETARIPAERVHRMKGEATDRDAAARAYEEIVKSCSPIDVMILGVGDDGHTASMFPGEATVDIADRTVAAVAAKGDREARITVTTPVIAEAKHLFVLAIGGKKTDALDRIWSLSGSRKDTPARVIRENRGSITWIIDKAAGGLG